MIYLALGDSISIDDYTGVTNGGAASQFAKLVNAARFENLTRDGNTTDCVVESLLQVALKPDIVTLTVGGNDFLHAASWGAEPNSQAGRQVLIETPLKNVARIARRLSEFQCTVIFNTIYDPTDGDDELGGALGISPSFRLAFHELNEGIRAQARDSAFILADLYVLFRGHGIAASDSWIVGGIEPNLSGATAIARHWHTLIESG